MTTPKPLPAWWMQACRVRFGLAKVRPPGMPKPAPKWCIEEWNQFAQWYPWFKGHKAGKRPNVWAKVPKWAWDLEKELSAAIPKKPVPPPSSPPPLPPKPKPSWTLPSPLIMTASDPDSAAHRDNVGTIGKIIEPGVCPLWECHPVSGQGRGLLGQIEGGPQLNEALRLINEHKRPGDHLAIVGTGGVRADLMLKAGVNVAFYELNAQAGWEPYGNTARLLFQGSQDGWPFVYISYGCYDPVGLQHYRDYVPEVWSTESNGFVPGTRPQGLEAYYACFSAEGMSDTNSWPALR